MSNLDLKEERTDSLSPIHQVASKLKARPPTSQKRLNFMASSTNTTSPSKKSKLDLKVDSESCLRREVLVKQAMALPDIKVNGMGVDLECSLSLGRQAESEELIAVSDDSEILVVPDSSVELEELLKDSPMPVKSEDGPSSNTMASLDVKSCKPKRKKNEEVQVMWREVKRPKRKTKLFSFQEVFEGAVEMRTMGEVESRKVPKVLGGRRGLTVVPGLDYGLGEGEGMVLTEEEEKEVIHIM